ncbi:conserved hypothetical protein [Desulforapulum autotrophicum HRM2]|uniref:Flippase-like domain-containing protein n=1 Tax=Desulforapulum autotrophicum (strain ATCC 43914 / DSM 3382 / VKM B-1955 / HRM2) TaxID=177437 RepID=C0QK77_DESAH|nr:lysylphosphatidylglycerol synthase transmembrane domain-containing protein [Desulforapulum autotrophicum]ACN16103.1 conserved hypothetical protein [Desulforapulum autotrophicum HRM2]
MNKKMILSLAVGILLSGGAIYLSFLNVPINEMVEYVTSINYFWVIPAVIVVLVCLFLRAVRWQIILQPVCRISLIDAFHPLMIGFMVNGILPGRVGEFVRPAILHQKNNIPYTAGLTTVAAERFLDLFALITLLALVFSTLKIDSTLESSFEGYLLNRTTLISIFSGIIQLGLLLLTGIVIVSWNRSKKIIIDMVNGLPGLFFFVGDTIKRKIQKKVSAPLELLINNIASGFALVKHPPRIFITLVLSFLIWGLQAFSWYLVSCGCPGIDLTFLQYTAVMVIVCFFIVLPSVPGYWGLWEAGGIFALSLFAVPPENAAGFILINHAVQIFPAILIGALSVFFSGVNFRKMVKNIKRL